MARYRRGRVWCVAAALLMALFLSFLFSRNCLTVKRYEVPTAGIEREVRIVLLSDLHGRQFGKNQSRLLEKIRKEQPELIAIVGDMLSSQADADELERLCALLRSLCEIAPVCYSPGNSEMAWQARYGESIQAAVERTGACYLEESYRELSLGGQLIRVGGLYRYAFQHTKTLHQWHRSTTYHFLLQFEETTLPTVLLCHRPDSFLFYDAYLDWNVDLLLCGHTHGGVIRLPLLGGVYVPDQGWWPKYDKGKFHLDDTTMVITSGFAGHGRVPRLWNLPEITEITLKPKEE